MNAAQIHLVVNHLPVLGAVFGAVLTAAGFVLAKDDLKKAGLWTFVFAGLSAVGADLSGDGAEEVVEHLPGVLESAIHAHEEAAEKALTALLVVGASALGVLAHAWRAKALSNRLAAAVLALSLPACALVGWAAHLGGLIRHTELRAGAAAAVAPEAGEKGEAGERD